MSKNKSIAANAPKNDENKPRQRGGNHQRKPIAAGIEQQIATERGADRPNTNAPKNDESKSRQRGDNHQRKPIAAGIEQQIATERGADQIGDETIERQQE